MKPQNKFHRGRLMGQTTAFIEERGTLRVSNPAKAQFGGFFGIFNIQMLSGGCLSSEIVNIHSEEPAWFETLYRARGAQLLLYGRALGLSHAEAEDVLQETFVALMDRQCPPTQPEHYCVRAYRNRALNYRR